MIIISLRDITHSWDQLFARLPEEFLINFFDASGVVTYYRPSPRLPFPFGLGMNIHEPVFQHTVAKKAWVKRQWYLAYGDKEAFGFPYFAVAFSTFDESREFQGVLTFAFPMNFVEEIESLHQDKSILQWILRLAESTLFIDHQTHLWTQFRDVFLQLFSYRGGVLFAFEEDAVKVLEWFGNLDLNVDMKEMLEQDSLRILSGNQQDYEIELNSLVWDRFDLDKWGEREVLYLVRDVHSSRHPLLGALLDFYSVTRQVVWQREEWERLHEELDQSQRFYAALAEINALVYEAGEETSLLAETCKIIHNYTKVSGCWAYQFKTGQIQLVSVVMDHPEREKEFVDIFSNFIKNNLYQVGFLPLLNQDRQPIIINDYRRQSRFQQNEWLTFMRRVPANPLCAMPIVKEDQVETVLMMIGPTGFFTKSINEVIDAMAKHVSIKLQSIELEYKTKVYHDMIEHMAYHDRLTGLKNRAYLEEWLDRMLVYTKERDTSIGLFMLDLDHFKPVNDQFGHPAGDVVLVELAHRITQIIPVGEAIRLGGDEFVIVVKGDIEPLAMTTYANSLISRIQEPVNFEGHVLTVGASVGMAWTKDAGVNPRSLLKQADEALYKVKQGGRNYASF